MNMGSYWKKMLDKKHLVFGVIWGLIAALIAGVITQVIQAIETIMDFLLQVLLWGLAFPGHVAGWLPFVSDGTMRIIVSVAIAIVLSPIAYKAWDVIRTIFKKNPI